ncbi:MAG: DUF4124 domain-containing protein [Thermomonas sp.]|uniref:DUF4124 domain-containing protein n=1 Tax=Thermomonas sp. TaxID=1971895 RepID=UPI0039E6ABF8
MHWQPCAAAILMLAAPTGTSAAELYRCTSSAGPVSYQAQPCRPGQRLDRVIDYQPVPDSPPMRIDPAPKPKPARATSVRSHARRSKPAMTDNERCRAAREHRDRQLQKLGLRRTYDQLGKLEEPVRAICRW